MGNTSSRFYKELSLFVKCRVKLSEIAMYTCMMCTHIVLNDGSLLFGDSINVMIPQNSS